MSIIGWCFAKHVFRLTQNELPGRQAVRQAGRQAGSQSVENSIK